MQSPPHAVATLTALHGGACGQSERQSMWAGWQRPPCMDRTKFQICSERGAIWLSPRELEHLALRLPLGPPASLTLLHSLVRLWSMSAPTEFTVIIINGLCCTWTGQG